MAQRKKRTLAKTNGKLPAAKEKEQEQDPILALIFEQEAELVKVRAEREAMINQASVSLGQTSGVIATLEKSIRSLKIMKGIPVAPEPEVAESEKDEGAGELEAEVAKEAAGAAAG